jgi:hypothetical protein
VADVESAVEEKVEAVVVRDAEGVKVVEVKTKNVDARARRVAKAVKVVSHAKVEKVARAEAVVDAKIEERTDAAKANVVVANKKLKQL